MNSELVLVDDGDLKQLRARPTLPEYLRATWGRRHFILADARSRALTTGRDTFLGRAWVILDPLLQVLLYAFIFGVVLDVSRGIDNFPGFLAIGVIFFRIATRGISGGINLIQHSRALITSFKFPTISVVLGVIVKEFFDGLVPAVIAMFVALSLQGFANVSAAVFLVFPIYLLIQVFCLGTALISARMTALVPDMRTPIQLVNRALFFVSGIFFTLERFSGHPLLEGVMKANPIYQFLHSLRLVILDGEVPPLELWISMLTWCTGVLIVGFFYFWAAEEKYADIK